MYGLDIACGDSLLLPTLNKRMEIPGNEGHKHIKVEVPMSLFLILKIKQLTRDQRRWILFTVTAS